MRRARWWMLSVTCLSVVVVSLDLTILNIALPSISAGLHAGTGDLQWLVDAYSLVFAGVMVPAGIVGDRGGRKRLLLMGLGAGIVFRLSLAVVAAAFGAAERAKAIGILTAGIALGLPLGPVLGG